MNVDWLVVLDRIGPDPLYVLRSTAAVMQSASNVHIDPDAVASVAERFISQKPSPEWNSSLHNRWWIPEDDVEHLATWIFLIDSLNFCFWGQGPNPDVRWRVEPVDDFEGGDPTLLDGYVALIAALDRGIREGQDMLDWRRLLTMRPEEIANVLRPAPGQAEIPLLDDRVEIIHQLGYGLRLLESDEPVTTLLKAAKGSAVALIRDVVRLFPSFDDVATWPRAETGLPANEVRFYKRAQILAGDLAGALSGSSPGMFHDLDQLTAFADYKVPQVLHHLGIVVYSDTLITRIRHLEHIPAGSEAEIEIRAATIWGVELLRQAMVDRGRDLSAHELDWLLWEQGQSLPKDVLPYHRTPTIFY